MLPKDVLQEALQVGADVTGAELEEFKRGLPEDRKRVSWAFRALRS